jgi:cytoskeletal protein CcmA (bactofilin family)
MWRKDEVKPQGAPQTAASEPASTSFPQASTTPASTASSVPAPAPAPAATPSPLPVSPRAAACISQGIRIKGEITGTEDLFVDGTVEGKLHLGTASVTVGPNGKVKADISAREVIVRGVVDGKIDGTEKVQLWNSGRVTGEVRTERLAIEDGALLRGKVEAGKALSRTADSKAKSASTGASEMGKSNGAAASSRSAVI